MKKGRSAVRLWAVAFWLAVWQVGSMLLMAAYPHGALLLASPIAALARLGELAVTMTFWRTILWSAMRIFGGFCLAVALAVPLAALSARFLRVRELLAPLLFAVKATPVASFIILTLVWLSGRSLSLFISALMVFPPVYLNLLEGIGQTEKALLEMTQVFRVPFRRRIRALYLPAVLPYFRSAVSLGLGLCWKAGIAAEVIGLPAGSLGERLYTAKIYYQTPDLFAWTAVIVAVSVVLEKVFLRLVDALAGKAAG